MLALLLACTFLIYQPGLYGDYVFDDFSNITANRALEIKELSWQAIRDAAISSFSGPLKRPVSMLTFAFNASTTGFGAPLFFKLTGLFVHLASGLAVFWLAVSPGWIAAAPPKTAFLGNSGVVEGGLGRQKHA